MFVEAANWMNLAKQVASTAAGAFVITVGLLVLRKTFLEFEDKWFYALSLVAFVILAVYPHGWHAIFSPSFAEIRETSILGGIPADLFVDHVAFFKADLAGIVIGLVVALGLSAQVSRRY